jgi:chemotaxis protein CheD
MKSFMLNINDVKVVKEPAHLVCYGLGSCIGLFIQDRTTGISGGAHIPLSSKTEGCFESCDYIMEKILSNFIYRGGNIYTLRAKIAGGANLFSSNLKIGAENIDKIIELINRNKIFLAAADFGGKVSRTVRFNTETGELYISTSAKKCYII